MKQYIVIFNKKSRYITLNIEVSDPRAEDIELLLTCLDPAFEAEIVADNKLFRKCIFDKDSKPKYMGQDYTPDIEAVKSSILMLDLLKNNKESLSNLINNLGFLEIIKDYLKTQ